MGESGARERSSGAELEDIHLLDSEFNGAWDSYPLRSSWARVPEIEWVGVVGRYDNRLQSSERSDQVFAEYNFDAALWSRTQDCLSCLACSLR